MADAIPDRNTAVKASIKDVEIKPELKRVRVMATVVSRYISEDQNFGALTLDDSSGTMAARAFSEDVGIVMNIKPGDIVDVIGRPREYQEEMYIGLESVQLIEDPNWELVRRLELLLSGSDIQPLVEEYEAQEESLATVAEEKVEDEDPKLVILNHIEEMDDGDGVSYRDLVSKTKLTEDALEDILGDLMGGGEIYEPKIGRFKRV